MSDLLLAPDIDCTAVAFDGTKVWATHRARLSLNTHRVLGHTSPMRLRGPKGYVKRLLKYGMRGFVIRCPAIKWRHLDLEYMRDLALDTLTRHAGSLDQAVRTQACNAY